jgi:hypothetical protein
MNIFSIMYQHFANKSINNEHRHLQIETLPTRKARMSIHFKEKQSSIDIVATKLSIKTLSIMALSITIK